MAHKSISIVHNVAGMIWDVITHEIDNEIVFLDTDRYGLCGNINIKEIINIFDDHVNFAISSANLIFFILNIRNGVMSIDYDIDHKSDKDVVVIEIIID